LKKKLRATSKIWSTRNRNFSLFRNSVESLQLSVEKLQLSSCPVNCFSLRRRCNDHFW